MKTLAMFLLSGAVASAAAQRALPSHAAAPSPRATPREIARVNGVSLTSDRLDAALASMIPMESFHRNISADKMTALRQQALRKLVDDELEYQDGVRRGVTVADADVNAGFAQAVAKYGGRLAFDAALRNAGASAAGTRREIRRSLTIDRTRALVVTATCQVDREEALRFFTANPDRFVEPEQLHFYAITVGVDPSSNAQQWAAAKTRAEDLLRQLKAGASFEELARNQSTDPSKANGGDMGFVHRGSLNDRFEQVAKELSLGQPSDVIESLYGYHIVRVSEIRPSQKKTFGDVEATLQKDLTAKRCAEASDQWIARLRSAATVVLSE